MKKPKVIMKHIYRETKEGLALHLVDSTALMALSTPVFTAFETMLAGIPNENSQNARLLAAGLTYAGMGRVFTKGMDISRKLSGITQESSEKSLNLHDALYACGYNIAVSVPFYLICGINDPKQIALGTATSAGLALVAGGPMGYAVDAYRDLTGLEESKRLHPVIRNQHKMTKLGLAGLVAGASIALTSLVYNINNQFNSSTISKEPPTQMTQAHNTNY